MKSISADLKGSSGSFKCISYNTKTNSADFESPSGDLKIISPDFKSRFGDSRYSSRSLGSLSKGVEGAFGGSGNVSRGLKTISCSSKVTSADFCEPSPFAGIAYGIRNTDSGQVHLIRIRPDRLKLGCDSITESSLRTSSYPGGRLKQSHIRQASHLRRQYLLLANS